ncbi:BgTH12-01936 [Blumeria graminis f. sp. triticale]|uniref:Exocyst complex component Sec8 n=1 Tax=Blumeria graminis f. sp. triticale TaxID=1689686 RepID=A0A9W4DKV2_BLUGR|nr:BgTH12-01936 [Blumeria graminis f. sp. triticale]
MPRNRYGDYVEPYNNTNGYNEGGYIPPPPINEVEDFDASRSQKSTKYGAQNYSLSQFPTNTRSGIPSSRLAPESQAEKQIGEVLEHLKREWPAMCQTECVPVHIALQLLDTSSVGRAHEYPKFEQTHNYLQESLKAIVHEHHQGFNSSIGTFHKIQTSLQATQKRVQHLKDSMNHAKVSIASTDPELKNLALASQNYNDLIHILSEIEELRQVSDQLEARISDKRFIAAVDMLQMALRRIRTPALDEIGALSDLRSYFSNQETALTDILIEELHDHLYLKSPYCQERWQAIAKYQGTPNKIKAEKLVAVRPFYEILDTIHLSEVIMEDPSRNPETDTFYYIQILVESLNKLGRLEYTVNIIKQRLPVELLGILNETNSEVDQKHPISLRGNLAPSSSNQPFSDRENGLRAGIIHDLLWTLYAKFEATAENHRVFHEAVKTIARREGSRTSSILLGGFRELLNLYQNEIQSLLHNYVTTDADIYQFTSSRSGPTKREPTKDKLFKFSETDNKSIQMTTEYQELEVIIKSAVPGLLSGGKNGTDGKKVPNRTDKSLRGSSIRPILNASGYENKAGATGSYKSLIEPSIFNMSLLLPPTLVFLHRLKTIVPPGSDLATSTLTSFLDNFLVNVFLPQLDETLGKLSDSLLEESDAFQQDPLWSNVSRQPIFKGTVAFFNIITAFCKMLNAIPHDQALSQLIITQMGRYYDHFYEWFKSLTSKVRDSEDSSLKLSANLATTPGEFCLILQRLWALEQTSEQNHGSLFEQEIAHLFKKTNETPIQLDDIILDREVISSLCLFYTSMRWLAVKIKQLRHITNNNVDSSRCATKRPITRRWSISDGKSKEPCDKINICLPMTHETVSSGFDAIVSSYEKLAGTIILTLRTEIRCQVIYCLATTLSPKTAAPHLLEQAVNEPDPKILSLNSDLVAYDEIIVKLLRVREACFIRKGLGLLVDNFLVTNAGMVKAMNSFGCGRMQLNILVLQQNLKAIEPETNLNRATAFFNLFIGGPDAVIRHAKNEKEKENTTKKLFSYEELKTLIELCYSQQISSSDRGSHTIARRAMGDHMLQLTEYLWES